MDREAFAKLLPEQAPAALTKWASTQESELGNTAYTVYRCERRYQTPAMEDLFENRTRGSRYWATLCNCTVCGEEWYTRKGRTAASFFVIDGEDGNTYSAEPTEDPLGTTDELYYVEVTEGDSILCPFCGTETKVVKATTIGDGKTKRLQIAQLANIDGYTTIIYWLAENQIYQYGSSLTLAPRYAYALDEKGQIKAFSHRQYLGYSLDGEAPKWRPWDNTRDKWDSLYCDWGSINGRKKGTVGCPSVPFDMEGATGEKTGLAGYWQAAQGLLPLQYLRLWQKCPAVENLVNAGFADLLGNILSDANRYGYDVVSETEKTLDLSKRRPHEMLGLSKEDFRKIDRKIEPEDLRDFRALRKLAPKASVSRLLNMRGTSGSRKSPSGSSSFLLTPGALPRSFTPARGLPKRNCGPGSCGRHMTGSVQPVCCSWMKANPSGFKPVLMLCWKNTGSSSGRTVSWRSCCQSPTRSLSGRGRCCGIAWAPTENPTPRERRSSSLSVTTGGRNVAITP